MARRHLAVIALLAAAALVLAAAPQFRLFVTAEDLEKGKSLGVTIDALGALSLAPESTELYRASVPMLWCVAPDAQGNLLVGGGNPAQVVRLAPPSTSGKSSATTVFTAEEFSVFALLARDKEVFVATAPDGQIYRLGPDGKAHGFFKPEAKYIWALASTADGAIYAATGSPARLYRIDPSMRSSVVFECDEPHLRSLSVSEDGWLFLGSSGSGYVYRLRPDGSQVSVLYDAPLDEISQVLPASNGVVYASATGQAAVVPPSGAGEAAETLAESGETLPEAQVAQARPDEQVAPPLVPGAKKQKSALYRLSPQGQARDLWGARNDRIQSAVLEKAGTLLVGTGDRGRLFRLADDGSRTLLVELEVPQLTALSHYQPAGSRASGATQAGVAVVSSNPGVVFMLRSQLREAGEYESEVIDAAVPSRWGALSWVQEGNGPAEFSTRTGNAGKPDKTWSVWQRVDNRPTGASISSPIARFLQWRVKLGKKQEQPTRIKRVQVSFLQNNVPPEITQIIIHPAGDYFPDAMKRGESDEVKNESTARPANNQGPGRKTYQKGAQSISWQARDENNDRLQFALDYRMVGETMWRELAKNLQSTAYSWDSQTMPDGEYQVRLTVSDGKSNPPAAEATSEKTSATFIVDNTPPVIERLSVRREAGQAVVSFAATDALTRLKEAWYSIDAGEWQLVYPRDGVADQRLEEFHFSLALSAGRHTLAIKASDANGNTGFGRINFGE